jgi:hypothetical protein
MRPSPGCRSGVALITVVLTAALAACGGPEATAKQTAATRVTSRRAQLGPLPGSRALAAASAWRLLDSLGLPAGSRRMPVRPVPPGLDQPGVGFFGPGIVVDVYRLYRLPMTVADAIAFLQAHVPAGTVSSGGTGAASGSGVSETAIAVFQRHVPAGIDEIGLVETLVAGPGGSALLRADAQVLWYPPRSAAEYLVAARFRSVRIIVRSVLVMVGGNTGTADVTGGQRLIRPLVAVLDSMHATPPPDYPCASGSQYYTLLFAPAVPQQRAVVVESGSCGVDLVSVGGRPQPELSDTGRPGALVDRLLREYGSSRRSR